ncbi:MAG TPA: NUDIX domain-containing protein [Anaerolineales bacterium]
MSYRAGIILVQDNKVALIERHRAGLHYFTFPGGHVDEGETPEQAAVRETEEELGLQVTLKQLLAQFSWQGNWQNYYLVEVTGGTFGSGSGEEMLDSFPERGTYRPMWMPVAKVLDQPVKPRELAELVVRAVKEGWPEQPVVIPEKLC